MLEDAFEALIGAIHLDGGIQAARTFILQALGDAIQKAQSNGGFRNPKGRLQEWTQLHHSGAVPDYKALPEEGPEHARTYSAVVQLDGKELGRGCGRSKKSAESAAAGPPPAATAAATSPSWSAPGTSNGKLRGLPRTEAN